MIYSRALHAMTYLFAIMHGLCNVYRIVLNSRPGIYFFPEVLDPALNKENLLSAGLTNRVMLISGLRLYFLKLMKEIVVRGHHIYKHVHMDVRRAFSREKTQAISMTISLFPW